MLRRRRRLRCADWQINARLGSSSTTTFRAQKRLPTCSRLLGQKFSSLLAFPSGGAGAKQVALDVLPLGEAMALLEKLTVRVDDTGAKTLAEALDCLPLALDHAAAYCGLTQMGFADYAAMASMLIAELPSGVDYPKSVAATFDLAITKAMARCQTAEALMSYLAQCSPERIPMTLVEGAVEEKAERLRALAALAEVSLLKHDPFEDTTPAVTVHRLVQAVARARSETNGSTQGPSAAGTAESRRRSEAA
jgi:phosphohistidine phosphatase SixA